MARGRPSKYKPEFAEQAEKLCELGATDYDLAEFFKVTVVTIWAWKTRYPDFLNALKDGKENADNRVEKSLYHRACGYSHEDVHITSYQGVVTQTKIIKHYPPDTTACIIWLKNRQPDKWRKESEEGNGQFNPDDEFL